MTSTDMSLNTRPQKTSSDCLLLGIGIHRASQNGLTDAGKPRSEYTHSPSQKGVHPSGNSSNTLFSRNNYKLTKHPEFREQPVFNNHSISLR